MDLFVHRPKLLDLSFETGELLLVFLTQIGAHLLPQFTAMAFQSRLEALHFLSQLANAALLQINETRMWNKLNIKRMHNTK